MKIHLDIHLIIEGNRTLHRASFNVNNREYKEDPEFTAGVAAYKWIEQIKRETGHLDTVIELVLLNSTDDITDTVNKIRPIVPPDDLPY